MAHAFKMAFAHKNVRDSLERPKAGKKDSSKSSKQKKKAKTSSSQQEPPSLPPSYEPPSLDELPPSYDSLPATSYPVGHRSPEGGDGTPFVDRRSGSISGAGVTVEGLEEEVRRLQRKVDDTESRLLSLSPENSAVFELTLELSSYEDQLQVKQQQLHTLLELPPDQQPHSSSSSGAVGGAVGGQEMVDDDHFLMDAEWYQAGLPRSASG